MAFYVGCYQILADSLEPPHDHGPWALPDEPAQHMADTSNVEELFLDVTDMNVLPSQIQFGACTWTDDEGFTPDHGAFDQFYVRAEAFYVRGFTGTSGFVGGFYPATGFYVRSFSPTDTFTPMFYQTGNWYVRGFTGSDSFTPMFYQTGNWYVRGFTGVDSFTEFYVPPC